MKIDWPDNDTVHLGGVEFGETDGTTMRGVGMGTQEARTDFFLMRGQCGPRVPSR